MRSLPEIKAMNAHLRARQADIYEKALRKICESVRFKPWPSLEDLLRIANGALQRGEKLK